MQHSDNEVSKSQPKCICSLSHITGDGRYHHSECSQWLQMYTILYLLGGKHDNIDFTHGMMPYWTLIYRIFYKNFRNEKEQKWQTDAFQYQHLSEIIKTNGKIHYPIFT
jgi:hypothetical protein